MQRRTFLLTIFWPIAAQAHSYKFGDVAVGHAWALPTTLNEGQAFFPLVNNGNAADALVAARSDICALIELRQNNRYDDPPLNEFPLEPGRPFPMRPTARHLRMIGLRHPLAKGDRFKVILDFLNAGEAEIEAHVAEGPAE
jgi:periplasmic copper chaperone A